MVSEFGEAVGGSNVDEVFMTDIENLTGFKAMNTPKLTPKDKSIILFNILSNF